MNDKTESKREQREPTGLEIMAVYKWHTQGHTADEIAKCTRIPLKVVQQIIANVNDEHEDSRPLDDNERQLLTHVMRFGADGYPVQKIGNRWHWQDAHGVPGAPTTWKTKREAVEAFERFVNTLMDRQARARDAERRALGEVCH